MVPLSYDPPWLFLQDSKRPELRLLTVKRVNGLDSISPEDLNCFLSSSTKKVNMVTELNFLTLFLYLQKNMPAFILIIFLNVDNFVFLTIV